MEVRDGTMLTEDVDNNHLFFCLWGNKLTVIFFVSVLFVCSLVYISISEKIYRAEAVIEISDAKSSQVGMSEYISDKMASPLTFLSKLPDYFF